MNITRDKITLGITVQIVQKQDQRSGKLTEEPWKESLLLVVFILMGSKLN